MYQEKTLSTITSTRFLLQKYQGSPDGGNRLMFTDSPQLTAGTRISVAKQD